MKLSRDAKEVLIIVAVAMFLMLTLCCSINYVYAGDLPDPVITTGASRSVEVTELCTTSTKLVRNVPQSEKKAIYAEYGMSGNDRSQCKQGYEVDHLISLELGGSNEKQNLWPQSYCGQWSAHVKDALENKLHQLICKGSMTIEQAQSCIATDWIACYQKVMQ